LALLSSGLGCLHCGLPWLHNIQSLADVTIVTKACILLWVKNEMNAVMLLWEHDDLKALLVYGYLLNRLVNFHEI
jgi:hypothetical protein